MGIKLDVNGLVFNDDVSDCGLLQFGFCDMNCGYYIKKENEWFFLFGELDGEENIEILPNLSIYLNLAQLSFICEKLALLKATMTVDP